MDALGSIHVVDETTDLRQGVIKIAIVGQIDFFFLDRPYHTFGIAVLAWLAYCGHTNLDSRFSQHLDILRCGVLDALVAVMNDGRMRGQGTLQGYQRQFLTERASQMPATNRACEDVHDNRQVDKAGAKTHVCDVRNPDVLGCLCHPITDQIGEATEGMLTVGGTALAWPAPPQQIELTHEAARPLPIDDKVIRRPPQLFGRPTRAVGRILLGHLGNGLP